MIRFLLLLRFFPTKKTIPEYRQNHDEHTSLKNTTLMLPEKNTAFMLLRNT